MNTFTLGLLILIYFLGITYLGFLGYKGTKNSKDYLIGNREIHPFIMAMSYGATFISTSAIVGFGGAAGMFGLGLLWLTFLTIFVGVFIAFVFFGKRTRHFGVLLDVHTFPELLAKRYQNNKLQKIGALIIFLSMPIYAAVVLIGGARFIEEVLLIDFDIALTVFSIIIAAYVITGGIKGVMYTDALQGVIMFIGFIFLLVVTYNKLGGVTAAHEALTNMKHLVPEKLVAGGHLGWTSMPVTGSSIWWVLVSSIIIGVGIGVLAQPQLVVRFMMVKSDREMNRAILSGGIFVIAATGVSFIVGALSNVFFYQETGQIAIVAAGGNIDKIIPTYINQAMPSWFVYIFMLSLISAGMSTLSSQFHTMGTSIGYDFYAKFSKSDRHTMLITRLAIIFSIVIAVVIGYFLPTNIIARGTAIFFGVCAAAFMPAYIGGLYWKGATSKGATWSIIAGFIVSLICLAFLHQKESAALGICKALFGRDVLFTQHPWPLVDPIMIALPISTLVFIVVSVLTTKNDQKHLDMLFNK